MHPHSVFQNSDNDVSLGRVVSELFSACPAGDAMELQLSANHSCTEYNMDVDEGYGGDVDHSLGYFDFDSLNSWLSSEENADPMAMQACLREVSPWCGLSPLEHYELTPGVFAWAATTPPPIGPVEHCSERCISALCNMKCNE